MSTTHLIGNTTEHPDIGADIATDDIFVLHDTSLGRTRSAAASRVATLARQNIGAVVDTTATTLALTAASHAGKVVTVSSTVPIAITLPASAGTGNKYKLNIRVAATATGHTIKVANTTDVMSGIVVGHTTATTVATVVSFKATATDDTITVNGTTQGGVVGDIIELTDIKTGFWEVFMVTSPTGSHATPFSASV